ncbi:SDR family NAD(P)-dependent oxidoreductase [Nocardioides sp.]|uniref:SDR family NAD(P)-dependent oxidoreductase n=1 Tax=Nocardioides sp. TaxID=35761 RepID=UPI0039E66010
MSSSQIFPRFEGKTVLVTGAGTGFGAAIAYRAAQEGADVGVHYNRSRAGAERTVARIEELGQKAWIFQADISSWEQVRRLAEEAFSQLGTVDVLVNNVGDFASETQGWRELDQESLDRVIDVDVKGTLMMTHEFGARMVEQGHGAIVNIGSTVVVRGSARAPQYAAAKYAVLGITKSYAHAFAPTVRVNTFAPGFMETDALLARADWQAGRRETLIEATPLAQIPPPEAVAGTALFLASEDASHMTGGYLVADGGYNMVGA